MSRKGENIYKRKDGRWEGRYIKQRGENAAIRYGYIYGKTYKEVKEKMKDAMTVIEQNDDMAEKQKQDVKRFVEIAEEWMKDKEIFCKKSTIIRYQNLLKTYLLNDFGECTMDKFTYVRIHEFTTKLLLNGGSKEQGLSPKTVSDILSLLHNIFLFAESKGFSVPASNITLTVKQQKRQIRIFSIEEQKILCKYLREDDDCTSLGILLCLFTGLRIGELCALTWQDISMQERTVFVHQTMQRLQTGENDEKKTEILISAPKSACSVRQIPIPDEMFELLGEARTMPEDFLLTGNSSKYIEPRTLQYKFKKVLQKCGIEDANFHALRHTFATRCVEVGFDVKSLSEILGHANVNITLNRYVHPSMDLKRDNMSKLSGLFSVN